MGLVQNHRRTFVHQIELEKLHPKCAAATPSVLTQSDDISNGRLAELYQDPGVSEYWMDEHATFRDY